MAIDSVSGVNSLLNSLNTNTQAAGKSTETSFSELLNAALDQVDGAAAVNEESTLALLSGQSTDLHTTIIEAQKAELTLTLALQVRNKVVDAYNEVMRMQL